MSRSLVEKRARFRALHQEGCFLLPNPWDIGSALMLQHLGFEALASTSSGHAWTLGRPDHGVTRDEVLAHLAALSNATDLPVNADFESGFAPDPEGVAANVELAIKAGVSGLSIEDRDLEHSRLYEVPRALERLSAARGAIDRSGADVILVARTEGLLIDPSALKPALDKLVAFAAAGADCLYAPGVWKKHDIATMVRAVAPKPLNVLAFGADLGVAELADLGVRRISVGGSLAAAGWNQMVSVAEALKAGSFASLKGGAGAIRPNDIFALMAKHQPNPA